MMIFNTLKQKADLVIIVTTIVLVIIGLAVLSSASSNMSMRLFDEPYYFLKHQAIILIFGIIASLSAYFTPIKYFKKASYILLGINVLLLFLVFTPLGGDFGTANRWISIGGFAFQPSEGLKLTFIMALANWLSDKKKKRNEDLKEGLGQFILGAGLISGLLYMQPATSIIVIVMGSACIMYFINGLKMTYVVAIIMLIIAFASLFFLSDYRSDRIAVFKNPNADIRGESYHLNQALKTISSGGWFGAGYGKSVLKLRLPEPVGDSIFAILAEEFGFIGSLLFITSYLILVVSGLLGSSGVKNSFAKLMLVGFSSLFGIQSLMHIASISGAMPMTGVPLPFISYGGTSLIISMTIVGLMVNIIRNE